MRLRCLDLIRYGKFTDHRLDFGLAPHGAADFHLIYGPNEAGKSTTMQGWLDLLFGIPAQSRMNFLHAYNAMQVGAVIETGDSQLELLRSKGNKGTLTDLSGAVLPEAVLQGLLGGIDRAGYEAMFSLDDETLEKGGDSILSSQGDLGQMLFTASSGLAEMGQTLDALRAQAAGFFRPSARSGGLADLTKTLADLDQQITDRATGARDFALLAQARDQAQAAWDSAQAAQTSTQQRLHRVEQLLAALPLAARAKSKADQIAALPQWPDIPRDWAAALPDLVRDHDQTVVRIADHDAQMAALHSELAQVVDDPAMLAQLAALQAVDALKSDYDGAVRDLPHRQAEAAQIMTDIKALLQDLGAADRAPETLFLPAPVIASLRGLMARSSGLQAAAQAAKLEVKRAKDRLAALDWQLGAADAAPLDRALVTAVLQDCTNGDPAGALARADQSLQAAQDAWRQQVARLAPWTGDGDALAAMAVPTTEQLASWGRDLTKAQQDLDHASQLARQADDAAIRTEAALQSLQASGPFTLAEAAAARALRENLWSVHLASLDRATAERFETALRHDDQITAAFAAMQTEARQRAETQSRLDTARLDKAQAETARDAAAARIAALQSTLRDSLPAALDPQTQPDAFADWLRRRETALESWAQLQAMTRAQRAAGLHLDAMRATLAATLRQQGQTVAVDAPFAFLVAQLRVLLEQAQGQATLRAAQAEAATDLQDRLAAQAQADSALQQWQADWAKACADHVGSTDASDLPDPAAMEARLDLLAQLEQAAHDLAKLQDRIGKMQANRDRFAAATVDLARALDPAAVPGDPAQAWAALQQRGQAALRGQEQRQALEAKRAKGMAEGQTLRDRLAGTVARLDQMRAHLGCSDTPALVLAVEQIAARQALQRDHDGFAQDICAALGMDRLDEALAALDGLDLSAVAAERDTLKAASDNQSLHLQQLYAARAQAQGAVDAVGGDDVVARLQAQRQTVLLQIEDGVQAFLRQRLGITMVDHALQRYRDSHRSAMMQRASEAFRIITRGAYVRLAAQPEGDREVLMAIGAQGASKLARDMSKGTRFQLYLALRIAGYHEIAATRSPVPFIADDIMEKSDDDRAAETFALLGGMAQVGQVIYLTHHRHLCEIAQRVCPDVRVHDLG